MTSTIRLSPSGREVRAEPGDTVLGALERAGYAMPNNCRAGACGECKTKVLCGEVDQGIVLDMALSQDERADGYRLMCMAKPIDDVIEIEFGTDDARPKLFPPRDRILCVVTEKIPRTPKIVELRIRPVGEPIRYWPGQYLMVGEERAGAPPRPYSIACAPRADGEIVLLVARVADGTTSNWIHDQLAAGDRLTVAGPYGTFIGDPGTDTPVLCLAAGSGLAPVLALTDAALRRGFKHPVTLLYSARTKADVFDEGLMAWWTAKHRRFDFRVTYTGDDPPEGARFTGRIPEMLDRVQPDLSGHAVYIAGSPEFVDACIIAAKALGAAGERIFVEKYHPQSPAEVPPVEQLV
ncbi:MAG TPA: 2Fe-2S iron-sulfur cluster-binding protein [Ilumatobacter sp.]|nr:2Fe-2S iron-sulfur cluster-binding protein [Ilumatobacter sp.]